MNISMKLFSQLFAVSFGFWMLYGVYSTLRVRFFIVKRYEQDTELSQTKYFKVTAPWTAYMPAFMRSEVYSSHLWKFVVYWNKDRFEKKKKMGEISVYDDIKSPEQVISHFSKKEINRVKCVALVHLCVLIHLTVLIVFSFIWPDEFGFF